MSDLNAGSKVRALDTPPTVGNTQAGSFDFDATTYGTDHDAGSYADCGVAFVACSTGRALIWHAAQLDNSTTAATRVAPVVRTGSTVGSGSSVVAASDSNAIVGQGTDAARFGAAVFVEGLTPGDSYNVRLEHRTTAGTGTVSLRTVIVSPAT
jgi:hypothetical protein